MKKIKILENNKVRFIVGLLIMIAGIVFHIYDFSKGEDSLETGNFHFIATMILGFGAYIVLSCIIDNKNISGWYAIFSVLVFGLILNGFTYFYMIPKVEKNGIKMKAYVYEVFKKQHGIDSWKRGVKYEFIVEGKKYCKSEYSDSLIVGDTILIKHLKNNPHYHLNYIDE
jgi:hypothetical protein